MRLRCGSASSTCTRTPAPRCRCRRGGNIPPGAGRYYGIPGVIPNRGITGTQPPPRNPDTSQYDDAYAYIGQVLDQYGLGSLGQWAWDQLVAGHSIDRIMLDLRQRDEYKQRFPGMEARRQQGLPAMTETEYLAYETGARQLFRSMGLPSGFFDEPQDFANLLGGNVSLAELSDRVTQGYAQVVNAPAEVRQTFTDWFGAQGDSALAAFYLDPDKALPKLEQMTNAALIGGTGRRFGFNLNSDLGLSLAGQGVTGQEAQQGFQQLSTIRPLFNETVSEHNDLTAENQGVDLVFGTSGFGAEEVRRRQKERQAAFGGGGGAYTSQQGVTGLGTAPR